MNFWVHLLSLAVWVSESRFDTDTQILQHKVTLKVQTQTEKTVKVPNKKTSTSLKVNG